MYLFTRLSPSLTTFASQVGEEYQDHYTTLQIFRASNESVTTDDFLRGDKATQDRVSIWLI